MNSKLQWVLFDLDGTLTDSSEGITASIAYAFSQMQAPVPEMASLRRFIGPPLSESFAEYFPKEQIPEAIKAYRERYDRCGWRENKVYPGIPEALACLKQAGLKIAMATSKPEYFAKRIAEYFGLEEYFDEICGASMDGSINTKEEVLKEAMKRCAITDPQSALMVGDRKFDVVGAAAYGIETVGVLYGFGNRAELEAAGAYRIVHTVEEMAASCLMIQKEWK